MRPDDMPWTGFERLADALSADLLDADDADILASHPRQGARVQADAVRQALRRAMAGAPEGGGPSRDILRELTMRPQREDGR